MGAPGAIATQASEEAPARWGRCDPALPIQSGACGGHRAGNKPNGGGSDEWQPQGLSGRRRWAVKEALSGQGRVCRNATSRRLALLDEVGSPLLAA
jgi:hypothetical protein